MGSDSRNSFESDSRRRDRRDRAAKAVRIGAIAVLAAIAIAGIRLVMDAGSAQTFSLERSEGTESSEEGAGHGAGDGTSSPDAAASAPAEDKNRLLAIYVSGAVSNPGVYEIAEGSRVIDAIEAAGGLSDDARPESVNLARLLNDGEHIHIPGIDEQVPGTVESESGNAGPSGLVNINTADASALEQLPGIGPATARKIIEDRELNGPYSSVDDLARVSGIGAKKLDALRDSACV